MVRFLAGCVSALLLMSAGLLWWRSDGRAENALPPPPGLAGAPSPVAPSAQPMPPAATEKTREEKRFARYDRDKDGIVVRDEYLAARKKAYAKLDSDGDGRLSFEEYAVRTSGKFAAADRDRDGRLNAGEFATTRVVRKPAPRNCPPPVAADSEGAPDA